MISSPSDNTMAWGDLQTLVLPLPAFLATNSHDILLDPRAIHEFDDPHLHREKVRVSYRLNPQFFHRETSLDEPLVALLRTNRRGHTSRRWPLHISTELTYHSARGSDTVWSALVISSSKEVEREDCVNHVNRLLRVTLRPGYIQPLTAAERALFGRVLPRSRR